MRLRKFRCWLNAAYSSDGRCHCIACVTKPDLGGLVQRLELAARALAKRCPTCGQAPHSLDVQVSRHSEDKP